MDKERFGQLFYKFILILTTVFLLAVLILIKYEDKNMQSNVRYICCFYAFSFLLPLGLIVREYCLGKYVPKKMIIKIVVTIACLIVGSVLIFTLNNTLVTLAMVFLGFGLIMFVGVPTIPTDNTKNNKK